MRLLDIGHCILNLHKNLEIMCKPFTILFATSVRTSSVENLCDSIDSFVWGGGDTKP